MENENLEEKVVEVMEKQVHEGVEEVADSGATQLIYFFTSWSKYFKSISIKPRFLLFFVIIAVLTFALVPFRDAQKELTMESTRVTLEETFNNSALYQDFSDDEIEQLIDQSLKATENMYSAPIFALTNVISKVVSILLLFIWIFIVLKLLKCEVTAKQMLAIAVGATVFTSISMLVYSISIGATGSMADITSLGIFAINAPITSPTFVILNSVNIATIITGIFYYFMGTNLLNFSKNKSLIVSIILIVVPILATVLPTIFVSMIM